MLKAFLTAYDPSDLPGGSIDPMGFERGYLFLADKILPGLTNVASRPRYFGLLCAGVFLADVRDDMSPQSQYRCRLDAVLRAERVWALANILASREEGDDDLPSSGIRGVTYATRYANELLERGASKARADYRLLSRQMQYGVIGMYGNVADGMRLLERRSLSLSPALGEQLGEAFIKGTRMPAKLRKAVQEEDVDIPLTTLVKWGAEAHVTGQVTRDEAKCLYECLNMNPVRSRMVDVLERNPYKNESDTEIARMGRITRALESTSENADLREATAAICSYEGCYRLVQLGFERILWLCRQHPAGAVPLADLRTDDVFEHVAEHLPPSVSRLQQILDSPDTEAFRQGLDRLNDIRAFLKEAVQACEHADELAMAMLKRHTDVQHGKFDKGRRKMPWVENRDGHIRLTTARVGGLNREATTVDDIAAHPYRLSSADALIEAGRMA